MRQVIVLGKQGPSVAYVIRAAVPVGQENAYKIPGATSPTGNAADPDLPGLINGTIVQESGTMEVPQANGEAAVAYRNRVKALLIQQQVAFQARITALQPLEFFGAYYDGSVWTNTGG